MHSSRVFGTGRLAEAMYKVVLYRPKVEVLAIIGGAKRHPAFTKVRRHRRPEAPPPGHIDMWPRRNINVSAASPDFIHTYLAYSRTHVKHLVKLLSPHGRTSVHKFRAKERRRHR